MVINPSTPVTGATVSGLTSPTYTLTADTYPDVNGKQWAITALGGTQTGVTTHSVSSPFTIAFTRPKALKTLGAMNAQGQINNIGKNNYQIIQRKGVTPAVNQPDQVLLTRVEFGVPAGSDAYDPAEIKASVSLLGGFLSANADGIAATLLSGVM